MSTAARVEFAHPAPRRIARAQNCAQTWSVCTIIGSLVGVVASGLGGARTDWRTVHGSSLVFLTGASVGVFRVGVGERRVIPSSDRER